MGGSVAFYDRDPRLTHHYFLLKTKSYSSSSNGSQLLFDSHQHWLPQAFVKYGIKLFAPINVPTVTAQLRGWQSPFQTSKADKLTLYLSPFVGLGTSTPQFTELRTYFSFIVAAIPLSFQQTQ